MLRNWNFVSENWEVHLVEVTDEQSKELLSIILETMDMAILEDDLHLWAVHNKRIITEYLNEPERTVLRERYRIKRDELRASNVRSIRQYQHVHFRPERTQGDREASRLRGQFNSD